ncbi:MAG: 4Fe-4S dicluster domain-containing protein [Gemmatimonadota bacterium]|nr:4Fe-4S dicluster domain-containing protein [Gemmatimonadota bacterium]
MKRRDVVRTLAVLGGSAAVGRDLRGRPRRAMAAGTATAGVTDTPLPDGESMAVLVDTTKCVGCRMCEYACAEANGLEKPEAKVDFSLRREPSESQFTVVNRFETSAGTVSVKKQCMHCLTPACASACLTKALVRSDAGAVVWRESKCMGCRYCMISCPFDAPKFEYDAANPRIRKCQMCAARLAEGESPACVANCPAGALSFGPRTEMIDEANRRIYGEPDKYVHHIYGEHEAGGTGWLYLSAVPFSEIGFRSDIGTEAYPVFTKEFLYAVPFILTVFPPLFLALSEGSKARERWNRHAEEE